MQTSIYRYSGNIKRALVLVAIVLIIVLLWYSQNIVQRLRADSANYARFYAKVYVKAVTDYSSQDFDFIFDEIIAKIPFPMVISQEMDARPNSWNIAGLSNQLTPENLKQVTAIMEDMDCTNQPIPLEYDGRVLGYLHYGDTALIRRLESLPFIEISVVGLFIFLGYLAFQVIRSSEKRSIWVGMSKETAHQLGTPLTSLLGWLELLKANYPDAEELQEIGNDLRRLEKVSNRFSQIGSAPTFKKTILNPVIAEAVQYYRKRLPQLGHRVALDFNPTSDYTVVMNSDLFAWAIENLIKNALDAVPSDNGRIEILIQPTKHNYIAIDVCDNGKGIAKSNRKNIFRPGYSTKRRGWGLGLSLTKRIIADYHHGKIFVKESKPGERTIMRILLRQAS